MSLHGRQLHPFGYWSSSGPRQVGSTTHRHRFHLRRPWAWTWSHLPLLRRHARACQATAPSLRASREAAHRRVVHLRRLSACTALGQSWWERASSFSLTRARRAASSWAGKDCQAARPTTPLTTPTPAAEAGGDRDRPRVPAGRTGRGCRSEPPSSATHLASSARAKGFGCRDPKTGPASLSPPRRLSTTQPRSPRSASPRPRSSRIRAGLSSRWT
mmetsp:Transcript_86132/g.243295  ORF Transcript_86132/g.243295 Transcript_86132/m.243295 type:complete len:216 (-) Transcript_86132:101-748(-)